MKISVDSRYNGSWFLKCSRRKKKYQI